MPQPPCSPSTNVTKMLGTARQIAFTGPFLLLRSHCRRLETKLNLDSTVIRAKYCFFVCFFSRGIYTFRKPEEAELERKFASLSRVWVSWPNFAKRMPKLGFAAFIFAAICHVWA